MTTTGAHALVPTVETRPVDELRQLLPFLDRRAPLLWVRKGIGIAGIGEAIRLEFSGPDRMRDAAAEWRRLVASARIDDPVGLPGSGLVAFGSFAFDDESRATSVLIVPRLVLGRREGRSWITRITLSDTAEENPSPSAFGPEYRLSLRAGAMTPNAYRAAVDTAVGRIHEGRVDKVVLARDLVGHLPDEADLRRVLADLTVGYPDCWSYAVDGFVGASPETLVRVDRGAVSARVLAGTISRGPDADADRDRAVALAASDKNQEEHRFAVRSVVDALDPHSRRLTMSERPFALKLPNLWHLATDIEGVLDDGSTSLDLIDALHPTAAVAGTPTREALALIRELEPFDRGRYAGPVGWVDANGDGEWAIALRSAQIEANGAITAYAGCGIVGESDTEAELAETTMKFRPIVEAFG